jgi:hypothetical protein
MILERSILWAGWDCCMKNAASFTGYGIFGLRKGIVGLLPESPFQFFRFAAKVGIIFEIKKLACIPGLELKEWKELKELKELKGGFANKKSACLRGLPTQTLFLKQI